ncbi:hypothetical protein [Komagataeibacter medellinensis]|uniref:Uncharacterized protein n=1 Tax=Komagataeibacter medellinensis (strain NBRC 3288 / BCRC 11682 / LMG 1693 / Kondo 51) TaxID=634177 RepID=G2I733_KOMMN|nr:hypothetical protein [Komagataeibacter medellinensis]BAK83930.1 hypothetical protein GLX_15180 [Komagataeibacter medellinensis NBRC 3288]
MRLASLAVAAAVVSLSGIGSITQTHAADALGEHTATISFRLSAADLGAGVSWGKGVLSFEGHDYPFRIRGGSGAAIGFSTMQATGTVYNLYRLQDVEGTYWSVQGEATIGAGKGGAVMENNNGIHIKFTSSSSGARLAFSVERLTLRLTPVAKAAIPAAQSAQGPGTQDRTAAPATH